jgi:hypothetical protein
MQSHMFSRWSFTYKNDIGFTFRIAEYYLDKGEHCNFIFFKLVRQLFIILIVMGLFILDIWFGELNAEGVKAGL